MSNPLHWLVITEDRIRTNAWNIPPVVQTRLRCVLTATHNVKTTSCSHNALREVKKTIWDSSWCGNNMQVQYMWPKCIFYFFIGKSKLYERKEIVPVYLLTYKKYVIGHLIVTWHISKAHCSATKPAHVTKHIKIHLIHFCCFWIYQMSNPM